MNALYMDSVDPHSVDVGGLYDYEIKARVTNDADALAGRSSHRLLPRFRCMEQCLANL